MRDDELAFDDPRIREITDAAVDQNGGVQENRAGTFCRLAELDVRDDEAEIVLGLKNETDREIAGGDADEHVDVFNAHLFVAGAILLDEHADDETEGVSDA